MKNKNNEDILNSFVETFNRELIKGLDSNLTSNSNSSTTSINKKSTFTNTEILEVIKSLFNATGSRYFVDGKYSKSSSDFDFYQQKTESIIKLLESLDFFLVIDEKSIKTMSYEYYDPNTIEVWRYINEDLKIDIQLVKDLEQRNYVNELANKVYILAKQQDLKYIKQYHFFISKLFWQSLINIYCLYKYSSLEGLTNQDLIDLAFKFYKICTFQDKI